MLIRYRHDYSLAEGCLLLLAWLAPAGCLAWAALAPASYARWREPAMAALRLHILSVTLRGMSVAIALLINMTDPWVSSMAGPAPLPAAFRVLGKKTPKKTLGLTMHGCPTLHALG